MNYPINAVSLSLLRTEPVPPPTNEESLQKLETLVEEQKAKGHKYPLLACVFLLFRTSGKKTLTKTELYELMEKKTVEDKNKIISSPTERYCIITPNNFKSKIKDIVKKKKWFTREINDKGEIEYTLNPGVISQIEPKIESYLKCIEKRDSIFQNKAREEMEYIEKLNEKASGNKVTRLKKIGKKSNKNNTNINGNSNINNEKINTLNNIGNVNNTLNNSLFTVTNVNNTLNNSLNNVNNMNNTFNNMDNSFNNVNNTNYNIQSTALNNLNNTNKVLNNMINSISASNNVNNSNNASNNKNTFPINSVNSLNENSLINEKDEINTSNNLPEFTELNTLNNLNTLNSLNSIVTVNNMSINSEPRNNNIINTTTQLISPIFGPSKNKSKDSKKKKKNNKNISNKARKEIRASRSLSNVIEIKENEDDFDIIIEDER
jgi:hypothetical protein